MKLVQEFVKTRYGKLVRQIKELREVQKVLVARTTGPQDTESAEERAAFDLSANFSKGSNPIHVANAAASKGQIIEVVEEALKWRMEASLKRQIEVYEELDEKLGDQKLAFEVLSTETNTEFIALKNQIVEAAGEVLHQI